MTDRETVAQQLVRKSQLAGLHPRRAGVLDRPGRNPVTIRSCRFCANRRRAGLRAASACIVIEGRVERGMRNGVREPQRSLRPGMAGY